MMFVFWDFVFVLKTNLFKVADISKEELGDLVEKELQSTHETIDEAVRQLEVRANTFRMLVDSICFSFRQ